jgi:hypothetical protein
MHLPSGSVTQFTAEPFECGRRRNEDPALPTGLHRPCDQMDEPIVLNRLRQQGISQFRCRPPAKRTQPELVLTLYGMALTVPLRREISINGLWQDTDLIGDEFKQRDRWPFAGAQCTARVAQVAEHEGVAETVGLTMGPSDCDEIRL